MKNVIVTGAAGGMGAAVCAKLMESGYAVWGMDLRRGTVAGVHYLLTDITEQSAVENAYESIATQIDSVDAIVHTAGIYALDSLVEISEADFLRVFETNLCGAYRVNRCFMPLLRAGARVVIVTSELAPLAPLPFTGIYAIAKTALERYADSLRMELYLLGISVSVIRPGAVQTGLLGQSVRALDAFCEKTVLYPCNAHNFRKVVDSVETRAVAPTKIASFVARALSEKHPRYVYNINRNPLLRLFDVLPKRLQVWVIGKIVR